MMKFSFYLILILLAATIAYSDDDSSFFKKYTNSLSTCGYAIAVAPDENIGMAGSRTDASGVRTSFFGGANRLGDLKFVNTYSTGGLSDTLSVIASTPDKGFILAGTTRAANESREIVIFKVRANGTIVWKKKIAGGNGSDVIWGMTATPTGYVLAGTSDLDVMLLKISWQTGKVFWKKTYGDAATEYGYSVASTENGGVLVAGVRESNPLILKVDSSGKLVWHRVVSTLDDSGDGAPIVATTPSAYYIGSTTSPGSHSHGGNENGIVITKLTTDGKFLWSKHFHNSSESLTGWHLIAAEDGGVILSGQIGFDPTRAVFVRIDPRGKIIWKRMVDETNSSAFFSAALNDSYVLITGCVGQSTLDLFALKINQKNGLLDAPCSSLKTPAILTGSRPQTLTTYTIETRNSPIVITTPNLTRSQLPVAAVEGCN
jgi:hypothetical protein